MEKGIRDRIGLNIGSMLPWSAVPVVGLPVAARMTRKAGYAFWQVLPLRSVTVAGLKRAGIPVRFVEPAWNATTFRAHLRHEPGAEGMPTKLQDPLFFGDHDTCDDLFKGILEVFRPQPIYHKLSKIQEGGWVEIYPGLGKSAAELMLAACGGRWRRPYVVDLRHLRCTGDNGFAFSSWPFALGNLLPHTNLIHMQALDVEEWRNFLAGEPTELAEMLQFIRDWGYNGPFVVEFDPRATGLAGLLPWILADNLRRVREKIEEQIQ